MSFCTTCGRKRTGNTRFCTACGTEFQDVAEAGHAPTVAQPTAGLADPDPARDERDGGVTRVDAYPETMPVYDDLPVAEPPVAEPPVAEPPVAEPPYAEPPYAGPPYAGPAAGGPGRPPGRPGRIILIAAAAVLILGAGGGAYALVASHNHGTAGGQPTETASIAASRPTPVTTPASTTPITSASASPTASATTVAVAPGAASNPAAPQVTDLVNRYFTAINKHDYPAYVGLFDQQLEQPDPESSFDAGYATTTDSAETLTGISDTGSGGLAASITFTSLQNPADSPDNSSCDQWSITLYLVPNGTGYLIGPPPSNYQASYQAC